VIGEIGGLPTRILQAPEAVRVGEEFIVTVTTLTGGRIVPNGAEVRVHELAAEITPYDRILTGTGWYVDRQVLSPHEVRLQFNSPGLATIRVIGVNQTGERAIVESQIVVHP